MMKLRQKVEENSQMLANSPAEVSIAQPAQQKTRMTKLLEPLINEEGTYLNLHNHHIRTLAAKCGLQSPAGSLAGGPPSSYADRKLDGPRAPGRRQPQHMRSLHPGCALRAGPPGLEEGVLYASACKEL
ncbi:unnamed protein product [Rangifer tarandus platyrhynchus]|uniref:Uncharacterized protein n=2 Tax=Rangifer tarandus platyrhynchus TaxID=3082113 RepID=A0ABN8Z3K1_RANTA|nr:unnamed protein product [Rangifer tarandus platyrhynchus]CAI9703650.1 unnamed protein product [Rangifer tarandus platyrhynchus]